MQYKPLNPNLSSLTSGSNPMNLGFWGTNKQEHEDEGEEHTRQPQTERKGPIRQIVFVFVVLSFSLAWFLCFVFERLVLIRPQEMSNRKDKEQRTSREIIQKQANVSWIILRADTRHPPSLLALGDRVRICRTPVVTPEHPPPPTPQTLKVTNR